jgi:general secretion pathway protein I
MNRARGFTLIEVLVALAIVAIGMAALLSALASSADSVTYLREKTFAEWVALNRVEEIRLANQMPEKGKKNGDAELAGRKWKWEQEVLDTEVEGILRIDVRVKPAEVGGDTSWYAEVSGIRGNAIAPPSGVIDYFARPPAAGGPGGPGNPNDPNNPNTPGGPVRPGATPGGTPGGGDEDGGEEPPNPGTTPPTD